MLYLFIIILGCNNIFILNDRLKVLNNFINNLKEDGIKEITIFLSGGIKDPKESLISEALIMKKNLFDLSNFNIRNYNINFVIDELSTNTAENLLYAQKYLNNSEINYDKFIITTSKFHKKRVDEFIKNISFNKTFEWVLSEETLIDSYYWENIHIKNVQVDINAALLNL